MTNGEALTEHLGGVRIDRDLQGAGFFSHQHREGRQKYTAGSRAWHAQEDVGFAPSGAARRAEAMISCRGQYLLCPSLVRSVGLSPPSRA